MPAIVLQTQGLTKRFGSLTAVSDLSLAVYAGEIFGFLGPNGAGKTTSINMMCGLLKPDAGQVFIHGQPITHEDTTVRSSVGVCAQNNALWGQLTCLEQMQFMGEMYRLPGKVARQRGLHLLEKLDLADKTHKLARTLSGGMQRRLSLALALVHDPDLLILDEPEAGLDPQSRLLVREYIRSLARDKTIILTTHNMDEAERLADRVAIIDQGCLLIVDTPEALKHTMGSGDVLEIEIQNGVVDKALAAVLPILPQVSPADHSLLIRSLGVVEHLPAILDALRSADILPGDVRLRPNSLEDVFISLTGRSLRE